ncbi:tyrosine recombinase XerC [Clostridium grantii]|uniref:Site-specific recombinase XerD n=1 Tax=Clostridium grantii DSM 8605 TaxID=1121316 RepID=A0A1M5VPV8_9CLOT|nr:tyrosine recombinase XerC [Clostridium grantii]SHH77024.1 Site-specific recombinase XerD [Clostridium grantii DSM 8605]
MDFDLYDLSDDQLPEDLNGFLTYLNTIKGKSINTINAYKWDLTMFFKFMKLYKGLVPKSTNFDEIIINDIDSQFIKKIKLMDLYAFISFAENFRSNGNYAKARKVSALKSFFKFLHGKAKIISDNPAIELETPKLDKRNPVYLTLNESKSLLAATKESDSQRDFCIITLFLNCGLRLSELCSIDIPNIKTDTLTIIGKGNKERTVYLNNACIRSIESYLPVRNKEQHRIIDKNALFISNRFTRINKRTVEIMVKKYIKKAGLDPEKYTPHKLRHTAATLMYKYGQVDIRSLQKILGHENISTTQIYTHVDDETLRKAVNSNPLSD